MKTMTQYIQEETIKTEPKPGFYSGLITFTFSDSEIRTSFIEYLIKQKIINKDEKSIDQSTYMVHREVDNACVATVRDFCEKTEFKFEDSDRIMIFRARTKQYDGPDHKGKIRAIRIK